MMKKLLELLLVISTLMTFSTVAFAANEKDYEKHVAAKSVVLKDVNKNTWFYQSVSWAVENGIMEADNGNFSPNKIATCKDIISALYQYAKYIGVDVSSSQKTNVLSFEDGVDIPEDKYEDFQWACGTGIIVGTDNTTLNPLSKTTHTQLVDVLMRFDNLRTTNTVNQKNMKYDLVKETYSKNKITINYPQISNLSDSAKQKKMNDILKNDALKRLNNYKEWASIIDKPFEEAISASIDYEVKWKGANLLSIAYSGYSNLNDDRSERDYHAVNLDLNTGEILRLKDFVNIDQSFIDKFITKKFKSKNSLFPNNNKLISDEVYQSLDFLYQINSKPNYKSLQQYFEETDSLSSDSILTSCSFSYMTDHSLGIAVIVPHASGNYAEFEIGLDEMRDNIKAENKIWQDFPNLIQTKNSLTNSREFEHKTTEL